MNYIEPTSLSNSFTCPHCGTLSKQRWWWSDWNKNRGHQHKEEYPIHIGTCDHCDKSTMFIDDTLFFPDSGNAPFPNPEMPESVLKLYREASSIHIKSPRGAAALLRLAIQVLTKELGEPGKNINNDIGNLVKKGLPIIVQQSLDIVRVTGNDAVHPGQIDTDDRETVGQLFKLVNVIIEYMIDLPKRVGGIYDSLPVEKKDGIEKRDKK